jgi:RNA polymerase sigma-70 factor (ECF subfamily)
MVSSAEIEPSDESLVRAACKGDDKAFAQLVVRHKRRIFGLAVRFARDSDELDDICQDVFIKAYENLSSFRHEAPFEHWLVKIAVRVCHDALRSRKKERHHTQLDEHSLEVRDRAEEARSEARQARELLSDALSRLKPDERLVITLLELEQLSVREIAAVTGWSEANIKVRGYRARQMLKRVLEEYYER